MKAWHNYIIMTLRRRRIYFYVFFAVFLTATPAVILYSQGYTFDFEHSTLTKTGGIFINIVPKGTNIYINDILKATTGSLILSQGKLISRLAPNDYTIMAKKDGYQSWSKKLRVDPQLVTEARNIFLVPETLDVQEIDTKVHDVVISASGAAMAYVKENGIAIVDVSSPKIVPLTTEEGERIGRVQFGADENYLLIDSLVQNKNKQSLFNIKTRERIEIKEEDTERFIKIKQYPPGEPKLLALSTTHTLYAINLRSQEEKTVIAKNVSTFELIDGKLLYATTAPIIIYEKDMNTGSTEQLTQTPLENIDISSVILRSGSGHIALLDTKHSLFLYDGNTLTFQRIAENVHSASFSDDRKKLAWHNTKNEIYVYYLSNILIQPKKKRGDIDLITCFSKPITNLTWFGYDNEHLIFTAEKKMYFIELDGRDRRNTHSITDVRQPVKVIYSGYDDHLYFLDSGVLSRIALIKNNL